MTLDTDNIHSIAASRHVENFNFGKIEKAAFLLRALGNNLCIKILQLLQEHQKLSVTEIYIQLRMDQPVISRSLAVMRKAGIVNTRRTGKKILYQLNEERLWATQKFVEHMSYSPDARKITNF